MKSKDIICDYREVRDDYAFNPDIMNDEDDRSRIVKYIINRVLPPADKVIIILYFELHSYRKLGEKMGLSHMSVAREVRRIKADILKEYERINNF